ncbi:V-type proton ATPase subunit G1-like [Syzygium oleosum]|uniref:V-type proton ATPase subunit G1-like n=1 Tax=Syzygium oleosum TaxID=219896 RepID=UPI0011D19363|nr:V-type proton ATPase subunit G1-like [Syzygium oleosum]
MHSPSSVRYRTASSIRGKNTKKVPPPPSSSPSLRGNSQSERRQASSGMEANRGQGGIQQLLAAEQEAQQIVNTARNAKMTRLKQAKEEAEKEIAEYRSQMELAFQKKVAASSGDSGANVKRLEQETDTKISNLKIEAGRISHDVVQMLLKQVTTVKN